MEELNELTSANLLHAACQSGASFLMPNSMHVASGTDVKPSNTSTSKAAPLIIQCISSRSRGRPKTAWMSNITSWTGLSVEQLLRAVEDRYQWRLMPHDAANLVVGRIMRRIFAPTKMVEDKTRQALAVNRIMIEHSRTV